MKTKKNYEIVKIKNAISKMKKELERMKKNGFDASVIFAQETAIGEKEQQLEELTKKEDAKQGKFDENTLLTFSIVDDETSAVTKKQYKVAFIKNNRPVDEKKVDGFISIIATNKYEQAYPIIATTAKEAIENGYEVRDTKKNIVDEKDAENYLVILDGQHRAKAFLKCSMIEAHTVPNTHLRKAKDLGKYLVDINNVGTSWNQKDRFAVAALVSDDELAQAIADRISDGYNPTTAALIYTRKKISAKQVNNLLRGETLKLPKGAILNIDRGNRFIQLCKEAGIKVDFIKKRYFINAFNSYALSVGEEAAFNALKKLKTQELTDEKLGAIKDDQGFIEMLTAA